MTAGIIIEGEVKKELREKIIEHVEQTFSVMFNVNVRLVDNILISFNDDDMVTRVTLWQDSLQVSLRFVFPRPLLKPLLLKIYSPAMATHESSYEDAACEISNIVCSGIKTFLNQHGYTLTMEIPKIDFTCVRAPADGGDEGHLHIDFMLQNDGFAVDFFVEDEQPNENKKIF